MMKTFHAFMLFYCYINIISYLQIFKFSCLYILISSYCYFYFSLFFSFVFMCVYFDINSILISIYIHFHIFTYSGNAFIYDIRGKLVQNFSVVDFSTSANVLECLFWGNGIVAMTADMQIFVVEVIFIYLISHSLSHSLFILHYLYISLFLSIFASHYHSL